MGLDRQGVVRRRVGIATLTAAHRLFFKQIGVLCRTDRAGGRAVTEVGRQCEEGRVRVLLDRAQWRLFGPGSEVL